MENFKKYSLIGLALISTLNNCNADDFNQKVANYKVYSYKESCMKTTENEANKIIQETNTGKRFYISGITWGQKNEYSVNIFSNDEIPNRNVKQVVYYFNTLDACETFKVNYFQLLPYLTRKN